MGFFEKMVFFIGNDDSYLGDFESEKVDFRAGAYLKWIVRRRD